MMDQQQKRMYEVPARWNADSVEKNATELLTQSEAEIVEILRSYEVPEASARAIAQKVAREPIRVEYEGAGSTADVVAISVSLVPVIEALTPLLKPFAERGADLAYKVGLDIWQMLRNKLLKSKNIRLSDKPAKPARKGR